MNKLFLKIASKISKAEGAGVGDDIKLDDSLAGSVHELFQRVESERSHIQALAWATCIESIILLAIGLIFLSFPTLWYQNLSQIHIVKWTFILVLLFLVGGWNWIAWRELRLARDWKHRFNRLREIESKLLGELDEQPK
jgi:hypothetical protein